MARFGIATSVILSLSLVCQVIDTGGGSADPASVQEYGQRSFGLKADLSPRHSRPRLHQAEFRPAARSFNDLIMEVIWACAVC